MVSVYRHQVRALRQIRWPLSFAAQFVGVVGHGMADDVVAVGAEVEVEVSCRGRIAARAPVAGSRASKSEALIVFVCGVFVCLF